MNFIKSVWQGYIGEITENDEILGDLMDTASVYIYPHLHFYIGYNDDQIVAIQISTDVRFVGCDQKSIYYDASGGN